MIRTCSRRRFLAQAAMAGCALRSISGKPEETIIDIHQHLNYLDRSDEVFVKHQRSMGVAKTVLLPAGQTCNDCKSTHNGRSNGLAARVSGNEEAARLVEKYPTEFVFFCNTIPDSALAKETLESWLKKGAVGIGEQKFGVGGDSKPMHLMAEIARAFNVPVLIHFQYGMYNTGFDRFHRMLEKYPTVNFIGHAQTWWGHVDKAHKPAVMYPKSKVVPGGLTDRYLSDYPNMFGDLSAGSGQNSLTRDEEHGAAFLERHQDKLLYGSDCPDHAGTGGKCIGARTIEIVKRLLPDETARDKIFSHNAKKIIRI